mgnify:FL=1
MWKTLLYLAEKWPEMVVKWPYMSCKFPFFFLQNSRIGNKAKIVIDVIPFDPIKIFIDWAH